MDAMTAPSSRRASHRRSRTDAGNDSLLAASLALENDAEEAFFDSRASSSLDQFYDAADRSVERAGASESLALEMKQVLLNDDASGLRIAGRSSGEFSSSISSSTPSTPRFEDCYPVKDPPSIDPVRRSGLVVETWDALRVSDDGLELSASDFVDALGANMMVVEALGAAFQLINLDLAKNSKLIRKTCTKFGVTTLQRMVESENGKGEGTNALLWMKRMLQYTDVMFSYYLAGSDLPEAADKAYKEILHDCHPFVVRAVASSIRLVVPSKEIFCRRLQSDPGVVDRGIREFLTVLKPKLRILVQFYNEKGCERIKKCKCLPEPL